MSCRSFVRILLPALLVGLLTAPQTAALAGPAPAGPAPGARPDLAVGDPPTSPSGPTTPPDFAAASAQAAASGSPVEVTSQRTETTQVLAQPDGTFSSEVAPRPVFVHRSDGSWTDVDTTLVAQPDGSVQPAAAPMFLRLSAGGSGTPLIRMDRGDDTIALSWNGGLPAPTLAGDTATYPDVLPGVDFVVHATVDGFSNVVVVKTAAAASNPAVRQLHFGLSTTGGTVAADGRGSLAVVDSAGNPLFTAPAAKMWDSGTSTSPTPTEGQHAGGDGTVSTAAAPGDDSTQADLDVQVSSTGLTVAPDPSLLSAATFPVFLDPETTFNFTAWTEVNATAPGSVWRTSDNRPAVGHSTDGFGTYTVRSFLGFNTSSIRGAHVSKATLRIYLAHSWSCRATPVELWALPGAFTSRTTWNTQPSWSPAAGAQYQSKANVAKGYTGCAAGSVPFDATRGVARAAANRAGSLTLGLKASNENDVYAWKKFDVTNRTTLPRLDVNYDFAPNPLKPADLSTAAPGTTCVTAATNAPHLNLTAMTLRARANDPDGTQNKLQVNYEWFAGNPASPTRLGTATSSKLNPGSTFTASLPKSTLRSGDTTYFWHADVQDIDPDTGKVMSTTAWSPYCFFVLDSTAPNPPMVSSPQYPGGDPAEGQLTGLGRSARFDLAPNDAADVVTYYWSIGVDRTTGGTPIHVAPGATASLLYTPREPGLTKLFVTDADSAGNHPPSVVYEFTVPDGMPQAPGVFPMDGAVVNTSGPDHTVSTVDTSAAAGKVGGAVHFNGSTSTATTDALLDPSAGFSLSAWVNLASSAHGAVAVAILGHRTDGSIDTAADIGYDAGRNKWETEALYTNSTPAESDTSAVLNTWTYLTATWDASTGRLQLYVNGQLAGTGSATLSPDIHGPMQLGFGYDATGTSHFNGWSGDLDEVQAWDRLSFPSEVSKVADWELDGTGTDSTPYAHNLTVTTGASWQPSRTNEPMTSLGSTGGNNQYASTAGPVLRTDGSFTVAAWVYLNSKKATQDPGAPVAASMAAVCPLGSQNCPFYLEYRGDIDHWSVDVSDGDSTSATVTRAANTTSPSIASWEQLVARYDASTHKLRFYAGSAISEPVFVQEITVTTWSATGAFQIGRSKWKGTLNGFWNGRIDSVRVWGSALNEFEIADLNG